MENGLNHNSNAQEQGGFLFAHDLVQYDENEKITLTGGAIYRWNDAIIPVLKLDYYKLGIGVSYDVNVSKLKAASQSRGGVELTLNYNTLLNMTNGVTGKVQCPKF